MQDFLGKYSIAISALEDALQQQQKGKYIDKVPTAGVGAQSLFMNAALAGNSGNALAVMGKYDDLLNKVLKNNEMIKNKNAIAQFPNTVKQIESDIIALNADIIKAAASPNAVVAGELRNRLMGMGRDVFKLKNAVAKATDEKDRAEYISVLDKLISAIKNNDEMIDKINAELDVPRKKLSGQIDELRNSAHEYTRLVQKYRITPDEEKKIGELSATIDTFIANNTEAAQQLGMYVEGDLMRLKLNNDMLKQEWNKYQKQPNAPRLERKK